MSTAYFLLDPFGGGGTTTGQTAAQVQAAIAAQFATRGGFDTGSATTLAGLPPQRLNGDPLQVGDTAHLTQVDGANPAGRYVWNGTNWISNDAPGGAVGGGIDAGSSATFAGLPTLRVDASALLDGDTAQLTALDGANLPGRYIRGGGAWVYDDGPAAAGGGIDAGSAATFAGLPALRSDGSPLQDGDTTQLTALDGVNLPGRYVRAGGAWIYDDGPAVISGGGIDAGSAATFAALPTLRGDGFALQDGDTAHLTALDGANLPGRYVRGGGAWVYDDAPSATATGGIDAGSSATFAGLPTQRADTSVLLDGDTAQLTALDGVNLPGRYVRNTGAWVYDDAPAGAAGGGIDAGSAATFAALPTLRGDSSALQDGDTAQLLAQDGINQPGRYVRNGGAWVYDDTSQTFSGFNAHLPANTLLTPDLEFVIPFATEIYDANSEYTPAGFFPTQAGIYDLSLGLEADTTGLTDIKIQRSLNGGATWTDYRVIEDAPNLNRLIDAVDGISLGVNHGVRVVVSRSATHITGNIPVNLLADQTRTWLSMNRNQGGGGTVTIANHDPVTLSGTNDFSSLALTDQVIEFRDIAAETFPSIVGAVSNELVDYVKDPDPELTGRYYFDVDANAFVKHD